MYSGDHILFGKIGKLRGYEGTVVIKLEKRFFGNVPEMESIYLEIEGKLVPFFISWSEYSGADTMEVRLEGYESAEKAAEFTGCRVYLTAIPDGFEKNEFSEIDLTGYNISSSDGIEVGTITEVISNPGQWLLKTVTNSGNELLIPFHDDLVEEIDHDERIIVMILPEGLTDINK